MGFHIRVLVLSFLLVYCRPLVESGRVYAGLSPLYHLNKGTKNWRFFTDMDDVNKYVKRMFYKNFSIANARTKKELTPNQISILIDRNLNYGTLLTTLADTWCIYPVLLEDIIIARGYKFREFKKAIEGKYKYLNVSQRGKAIFIKGPIATSDYNKEQEIILDDRTWSIYRPLFPYIDNSDKRYIMNGQKVGLYEIISTFETSKPKNMDRAKGLGALKDYELGISTILPENRKLLHYTTSDIVKDIEELRKINDDRYSLINGIDISSYEF